jgi:chemotaxis protein histidine kinase CheA
LPLWKNKQASFNPGIRASMAGQLHFGDYLKAAFTNRWNLLLLFGATVAAIIAPRTDIGLPLVLAVELGLITMLAANPRYQRLINSQHNADADQRVSQTMSKRFLELYQGLDEVARRQFETLRAKCEVLRTGQDATSVTQFSDEQLSGVDRLLWVYLKLLHTRLKLQRFFRSTDKNEIENLEQSTRLRLDALPKESPEDITVKMRRSLEDTLATAVARRDNLKRAQQNSEFVELELERIAAKLTAVSEMAINRQDPAQITHEVDDVARSVESTEQAIGELQMLTGLTTEDTEAPPILRTGPQRVRA